MKDCVVFLLLILAVSCNDNSNKKSNNKVTFFYYFEKQSSIKKVSFVFYRLDYSNPEDTLNCDIKCIRIIIPETDTIFSLKNDLNHEFIFSYSFIGNDSIYNEKIESGEISGNLIDKELWEIKVKTKGFDFRSLTSTKKSKYGYFETFYINPSSPEAVSK